uniref:Uncharacterized protein n=1 Tax=Panagrolaimus sp. PS1159 TaxID=55785 RepID=A0AC35GKV6_9BILA
MATFAEIVAKAIQSNFGGFRLNQETNFTKTKNGINCAVYLNQGISYTTVIMFYENDAKQKSEDFFFATRAGSFSSKLMQQIPQFDDPLDGWNAALNLMK